MTPQQNNERHDEQGESFRCVIITVSDTHALENDEAGIEISRQLRDSGHEIVERTVVPSEPARIALVLRHWLGSDVDAVILSGETVATTRDGLLEVVRQFLNREFTGFGEIFCMLNFKEIGAAAALTRMMGGISNGKVVFALPSSKRALRLGMEKLVLPELRHIIYRLRRGIQESPTMGADG